MTILSFFYVLRLYTTVLVQIVGSCHFKVSRVDYQVCAVCIILTLDIAMVTVLRPTSKNVPATQMAQRKRRNGENNRTQTQTLFLTLNGKPNPKRLFSPLCRLRCAEYR